MAFSVGSYDVLYRGGLGVWCEERGRKIPLMNLRQILHYYSCGKLPPMHKPCISNFPEGLELLKNFS